VQLECEFDSHDEESATHFYAAGCGGWDASIRPVCGKMGGTTPEGASRAAWICVFAAVLALGCDDSASLPTKSLAADPEVPRLAHRIEDDRLAEPVPVEADGQPLTRQRRGYALEYPFVGDIDGDGRPDLLLGDRDHGRLRVFRNVGTCAAPQLAAPVWFDETVPTGKVPKG
jgi:hypothetical protein